jgi:uncharacterized membrane protein YkvA (DUF1232 family)
MTPTTGLWQRWRTAARTLKRDILALVYAYRDPRTPWLARVVALGVVLYAVSPLDLIPDQIPVLGHLDDLILLPLGIWLCLRLIPPAVMDDARRRVETRPPEMGRQGWAAAVLIVAVWLAVAAWLLITVLRLVG